MSSNTIRVLIVDDEPLARRGIRRLLEPEDDFVIEGEASNGREAEEILRASEVDLVFLDIQMPLLDGFALLDELEDRTLPEIVFVTAFDEHAVRAFEAGAIDYVLKPIDPVRFKRTLDRVRRRIISGDRTVENKITDLLAKLIPRNENYLTRLAVHQDERIKFLNVDEIDWIGSQGNYIELHSNGSKFLLRETMSRIEQKLDPQKFLRIRRSTIVRIDCVRELQTMFNGEFAVVLNDGTEFTTSRRYRRKLEGLLRS